MHLLTSFTMFGCHLTAPALCVIQLEHGLPVCFDVLAKILLLKSLQQTRCLGEDCSRQDLHI